MHVGGERGVPCSGLAGLWEGGGNVGWVCGRSVWEGWKGCVGEVGGVCGKGIWKGCVGGVTKRGSVEEGNMLNGGNERPRGRLCEEEVRVRDVGGSSEGEVTCPKGQGKEEVARN